MIFWWLKTTPFGSLVDPDVMSIVLGELTSMSFSLDAILGGK
jgi:hypothetical protein